MSSVLYTEHDKKVSLINNLEKFEKQFLSNLKDGKVEIDAQDLSDLLKKVRE